ncbi:MAG: hypothetical protein HS132_12035 [Planctomycetia bacterium]|nr:hypothetical protein [Planctomycetia bacterium]
MFEPHTEWLYKGKSNKRVELGHNILVTSDRWGFIVDHVVVEKQADVSLSIPLTDRLLSRYRWSIAAWIVVRTKGWMPLKDIVLWACSLRICTSWGTCFRRRHGSSAKSREKLPKQTENTKKNSLRGGRCAQTRLK